MSRRVSSEGLHNIFTFTEVTLPKQSNKKLPIINSLKLPRSSSEATELKTETTRNWKDFLDSTFYAGNYKGRDSATSRNAGIQIYLDKISGAVAERLGNSTSRSFAGTKYRTSELYCKDLEKKVLRVKTQYNQTQEEVLEKEHFVGKIQIEVDALKGNRAPGDRLKRSFQDMQAEYNEILKGLNNECAQREVLLRMVQSRKSAANSLEIPINELKTQLSDVTAKLNETDLLHEKFVTDLKHCKDSLRDLGKQRRGDEKVKKNELFAQLLEYQKNETAFHVVQKQHSLNSDQQIYQKKLGLMQVMGPMTQTLDKEETELQELKAAHALYKNNKQGIKGLKRETRISSICEVKHHYMYLKEVEGILRIELTGAMNREETLKEVILKTHEEGTNSVLSDKAFQEISWKQKKTLDSVLSNRNRDASEIDAVVQTLDSVVINACSSISRIYVQLYGQNDGMDCKPRNLLKYFGKCSEQIKRAYEENVNNENGQSEFAESPHSQYVTSFVIKAD